jgi:DNA-directed RNA polymerase I, II, and III subunit RPABC1
METSDEINWFKVRKTVFKMLDDRGYIITKNQLEETLESHRANQRTIKDLTLIVAKKDNSEDQLYVEFSDTVKLGVNDITNFAETLHKYGVKTGIIINKGSITPLAKMVSFT